MSNQPNDILLAQLSDIHFEDENDIVLQRIGNIVDAIFAEYDNDICGCILINSGDAANKGGIQQFELAERFFKTIIIELKRRMGDKVPVELVMVPGNHDCDFSGDQAARDGLLPGVLASKPAASILNILLAPLQNYFAFSRRLIGNDSGLTIEKPFFRRNDFEWGGIRLRINLINSAWTSSRHEAMGTLKFPSDEINCEFNTHIDYSVSVIHHPLHWFQQPDVMRDLLKRIESISDMVFTGHEHSPLLYQKRVYGEAEFEYVEGGALQERTKVAECKFNVVRFRFANSTQDICTYSLSKSDFFEKERASSSIPLGRNSGRADGQHKLKDAFERFLDDLELPLIHHDQEKIKLSHIFTYPDLRFYDLSNPDGEWDRIKGEIALGKLLSESHILITGSEKSGKTSLAKRLFVDSHRQGFLPLFLDASDLGRSGSIDGVRRTLSKLINEQYRSLRPEQFEQMELGKKILIVDRLEQAPEDRTRRREVLEYLKLKFGKVFLVGDDEFCLQEFYQTGDGPSGELNEFNRYDICEFGKAKIEALTRNWLQLSHAYRDAGTNIYEDDVKRLCLEVENVLRADVIPHHPWIVLVLLQHANSGEPLAAKNGSYGHMLQAIITVALNTSNFRKLDIKTKFAYMGEFAFSLHTQNVSHLNNDLYKVFHKYYCNKYDVEVDHEAVRDDLSKIGILSYEDGKLAFRAKYAYCFFVALHISNHIHRPEIRQIIETLSNNIYHEESANIIVFLAHLSNDPIIIHKMTETASKLFHDSPLANLDADVESLNLLRGTKHTFVLPSTSPTENRNTQREQHDERLARRDRSQVDGRAITPQPPNQAQSSGKRDASAIMLDIHATGKSIQILGQVLRNGAGSMLAEDKSIIIKEILNLSRRLFGFLFTDLLTYIPEWQAALSARYKETNPNCPDDEAEQHANRQIFNLCWMAVFRFVRHVSESVNLELLSGTFTKMLDQDKNIPNQLVGLSFLLDRSIPNHFPTDAANELHKELAKNKFSQMIVRALVVNHLLLFEVKEKDKQAVSAEMNIDYSVKSLNISAKKFTSKKSKSPKDRRKPR